MSSTRGRLRGMLAVKLRRDLRALWSRFALMVLAITVSLTAFGTVLTAWAGLSRETTGAYLSTEPASATLLLKEGLEPARMAALAAEAADQPGILQAVGRTQFSSRVQVNGQERAIPVLVFAAADDDPMRMARLDRQQPGSWPPPPTEIRLDEDTFDLIEARPGDTLTLAYRGGGTVQVRAAADTVYDPSLSPSPQEQTGHGYLSLSALSAAGRPALLDQLKVQIADPGGTAPSRDRDTVVAAARSLAAWLEGQGVPVTEAQVPTPYAHPHQWQSDMIFLSLLVAAGIALVLSGVLVATMLSNLFTRQIPQIGILKAIGASTGAIARLYLAMVLVVATAATALSVGPALLIGRGLLGWALSLLGIQPVSLNPPWWTVPTIIAAGLLLPTLLALTPLIRACRTTVRQAIDHHGGSAPSSRVSGLLARLNRLRGLNRGLLMALRNTARRPARSLLAVGLLATAGAVFVTSMSLGDGMQARADNQTSKRTWDVDVALGGETSIDDVLPLIGTLDGVQLVEGWSVAPTAVAATGQVPVTRTYPDQGHGRVSLTAVPAGSSTFTPPSVLEGRWLNPGETGALVLNRRTRDTNAPGAHPGDTVTLLVAGRPVSWRLVGVIDESEGGGAYATAEGLAAARDSRPLVNQLRIVTTEHDEPTRAAVARAVQQKLDGAGVAVSSAASVSRAEAAAEGHAGPLITIFMLMATVFGVVGGISLATTMGANILERTREFGVLHAIGARPRIVRRIVTAEGIMLTLASFLIAAGPALGLTKLLGAGLGNLFLEGPLPYRISPLGVGAWLVLALGIAVLATNAAAARAATISVRAALDDR